MKRILFLLCAVAVCVEVFAAKEYKLLSPNGKLEVSITAEPKLAYSVKCDGEQVLDSAEGAQEAVAPIAEVVPAEEKPAEAKPADEPKPAKSEETAKRRPAKRRKRVEEEEKELFPFYEQSLF